MFLSLVMGSPPDNLEEIGQPEFEAQVLKGKGTVLVAFFAPWSMACQVLKPVLIGVATRLRGAARVVGVNVDDYPDLGLWYNIESIPTLLYFIDGNIRGRIVGTASAEAIMEKLETCRVAGAA